jgi:hypothetical protein
MTLIRNFNYSEKEISMMIMDSSNSHLWVGFKQDTSGNCAFQKVSWNNPLQIYFNIDLAVTEIKSAVCNSSYIYLALNDSSLLGRSYTRANPIATPTDFNIPGGITEAPVDILVSTYVYFLIPGDASGTNTKIAKFNTSGTYIETIDLTTVTNARAFAEDSGTGDIWVITYTSPGQYVRVYDSGGWNYTVNT